jgi:hypothetical protein
MSKAPPIPREQRSFHGHRPDVAGHDLERGDEKTGVQSIQSGDSGAHLKAQGRQSNVRQSPAPHRRVLDR